jgi:hemoglobin
VAHHRFYRSLASTSLAVGTLASMRMLNRSTFELAGGEPTFRLLVRRFYTAVASDPVLRPVYPDEDLEGPIERLTLFLIQYWGGPDTYSAQRGHPRLRLRHQPFAIGPAERDAWLGHMTAAVESLELAPAVREAMLDYFDTASTAMINRPAQV